MALYQITGTLDLSTKGRSLGSWAFSNTGAAGVINFRNGTSGGTIFMVVQLAATTSASQSYDRLPIFPLGVYVEVVSGTITGNVDLY